MNDKTFQDQVDTNRRLADLRGTAGKPAAAEGAGPHPPPQEDDPAFSILSADRQQKVMLELRFKNGNAKALAYSYLVGMDFDPSKEIVMDFSAYEVRIKGRNLAPLFAGLVAQRVAVVQERDDLQAEASLEKDATVVTAITSSDRRQ